MRIICSPFISLKLLLFLLGAGSLVSSKGGDFIIDRRLLLRQKCSNGPPNVWPSFRAKGIFSKANDTLTTLDQELKHLANWKQATLDNWHQEKFRKYIRQLKVLRKGIKENVLDTLSPYLVRETPLNPEFISDELDFVESEHNRLAIDRVELSISTAIDFAAKRNSAIEHNNTFHTIGFILYLLFLIFILYKFLKFLKTVLHRILVFLRVLKPGGYKLQGRFGIFPACCLQNRFRNTNINVTAEEEYFSIGDGQYGKLSGSGRKPGKNSSSGQASRKLLAFDLGINRRKRKSRRLKKQARNNLLSTAEGSSLIKQIRLKLSGDSAAK